MTQETPVPTAGSRVIYVLSMPSRARAARKSSPKLSFPMRPKRVILAPNLLAAIAWLKPLPPRKVPNSSPTSDSPGCGKRGARITRSVTKLPRMMMLPIADIPFSVLAFDWIRMLDHVEEELSRRSYRFLTIPDIHSLGHGTFVRMVTGMQSNKEERVAFAIWLGHGTCVTGQVAPQREERGGQSKATEERSLLVLSLVYEEA